MTRQAELQNDIKESMRAKNKARLDVLRLIAAAIKQVEVDERISVDDVRFLLILDKMAKQRHESITHYQAASRADLVQQEQFELSVIQHYLPTPLSEAEIDHIIQETCASMPIERPADIGKVMAHLKPQLQGRADMSLVSQKVKAKINAHLG